MFMQEHDVYVGTMLDELNLRFAPSRSAKEHHGGIDEMVELQKEFGIFKEGRPFYRSAQALHLGGSVNHEVKNRFGEYLKFLRRQKSNVKGKNGDDAIVSAIVANLAAKTPLPVHFATHDMREGGESAGVIVRHAHKPLFYMTNDYLSISLPAAPHEPPAQPKAKTGKK
jgi:hypothetical protein